MRTVSYDNTSSLSGTSDLSLSELLDLLEQFKLPNNLYPVRSFFTINLDKDPAYFQFMYTEDNKFLVEIPIDTDTMSFWQKYANADEVINLIKHFYDSDNLPDLTNFHKVNICNQTLDEVIGILPPKESFWQ